MRNSAGVSLVELMVGLAIVAFGLVLGAPSFSEWMQNSRIRTAADSLQAGLNLARSEAIRRNTPVRFQLVDNLGSGCALSTSGGFWVVNLTSSTSPASGCNSAPSNSTSPYIVQANPLVTGSAQVTVAAGQSVVSFNGLGRQTASTNPTAAVGAFSIDISPASGTCLAAGGTLRCLRVTVSVLGQIRLCDPSKTSSGTNNDPTAC